jgi:ribulose-phosphate 3-epimerase
MKEKGFTEMLLCPSIFNLDFDNLREEILKLDTAGTDIFHVDFMDGNFVANFGLSLQDLDVVRRNTKKKIDAHLMVRSPIRYIKLFADHGADIIYIHPESEIHSVDALSNIKELGKSAGIAVNPDTSIAMIKELFPLVDYVLVMAVNPGFAGQPYLMCVEDKITELIELKKRWNFKIIIDGGVTREILERLVHAGVDGFVLGNLILFKQNKDYQTIIKEIRQL